MRKSSINMGNKPFSNKLKKKYFIKLGYNSLKQNIQEIKAEKKPRNTNYINSNTFNFKPKEG